MFIDVYIVILTDLWRAVQPDQLSWNIARNYHDEVVIIQETHTILDVDSIVPLRGYQPTKSVAMLVLAKKPSGVPRLGGTGVREYRMS